MKLFRLIRTYHNLYAVIGPILHKSLEVGLQLTPASQGIDAHIGFRSRGDHAGLRCSLQLGKLLAECNLTDGRHWHHAEARWRQPGEDQGGDDGCST